MRIVHHVESLNAELNIRCFTYLELPEDAQINVQQTGTSYVSQPAVSIAWSGRLGKCIFIHPPDFIPKRDRVAVSLLEDRVAAGDYGCKCRRRPEKQTRGAGVLPFQRNSKSRSPVAAGRCDRTARNAGKAGPMAVFAAPPLGRDGSSAGLPGGRQRPLEHRCRRAVA